MKLLIQYIIYYINHSNLPSKYSNLLHKTYKKICYKSKKIPKKFRIYYIHILPFNYYLLVYKLSYNQNNDMIINYLSLNLVVGLLVCVTNYTYYKQSLMQYYHVFSLIFYPIYDLMANQLNPNHKHVWLILLLEFLMFSIGKK